MLYTFSEKPKITTSGNSIEKSLNNPRFNGVYSLINERLFLAELQAICHASVSSAPSHDCYVFYFHIENHTHVL